MEKTLWQGRKTLQAVAGLKQLSCNDSHVEATQRGGFYKGVFIMAAYIPYAKNIKRRKALGGKPAKSPLQQAIERAIARCDPNNPYLSDFDRKMFIDKGIKVCVEWRIDWRNALKTVGERPAKGYSLRRLNLNKDYTPENCRWFSKEESDERTGRDDTDQIVRIGRKQESLAAFKALCREALERLKDEGKE